jgi:hypothetical protein
MKEMRELIRNNKHIRNLLVFSFFLLLFVVLYMTLPVVSTSDDHYFHFRFTQQIISSDSTFLESFRSFDTLALTNIADGVHFLYYKFLFYIFVAPFTFITPLFVGMKLFAVVILSLIGYFLYKIINDLGIRYPFLWSVGFFAAIGVGAFGRLFLSRPFVFSPIIVLLIALAMYKKKYIWIYILSFLCLFWHTATLLIPIIFALIYFFVHYFYYKEFPWKEVTYTFLGTTTAFIVSYLIDPGYLISIADNLFGVLLSKSEILGETSKIQSGSEVYPGNIFAFVKRNMVLFSMFIFSISFYVLKTLKNIRSVAKLSSTEKRRQTLVMTFFVLSTVFFLMIQLVSKRFIDFFIFFSWIFIAFTINEVFSEVKFLKKNTLKYVKISVLVVLVYLLTANSLGVYQVIATEGSRPHLFKEVGTYLNNNLKEDEIVFNVWWGWFPQLYYYAPKQNYVTGLEPRLNYVHNPEKYWLMVNIGKGYVCYEEKCEGQDLAERNMIRKPREEVISWLEVKGDEMADVIQDKFQSSYVVTSRDFLPLNRVLVYSPRFELLIESGNGTDKYYLYKVLSIEEIENEK